MTSGNIRGEKEETGCQMERERISDAGLRKCVSRGLNDRLVGSCE